MSKCINKKFGDYKVIGFENGIYTSQCDICGNIKNGSLSNLQQNPKHGFRACGENYAKSEIGKIYGDMEIIEYIGNIDRKFRIRCTKCKREKVVCYRDIKNLKRTSHEGCRFLVERDDDFRIRWQTMRARTTNPNNDNYERYGGRGISSECYKYYIDFYDDMYESYLEHVAIHGVKNTTLDRIDFNEHYVKSNLKWATWKEQANNRSNNVNKNQ